ncbi:MAG: hypothetical protein WC732_01245 [Candidatus Omnitrophota bacterium]
MHTELLLRVRALFEEYLRSAGFVLVDMRFFRDQARRAVLEILADRPQGGITLAECGQLNRELGEILENSGLVEQSFILDVSSPGLDRPLATEADFRRARGRRVRFYLKQPVEGTLEHCGVIEDVSGESVRIGIKGKDMEKTIEIPLENINKAKQVIE